LFVLRGMKTLEHNCDKMMEEAELFTSRLCIWNSACHTNLLQLLYRWAYNINIFKRPLKHLPLVLLGPWGILPKPRLGVSHLNASLTHVLGIIVFLCKVNKLWNMICDFAFRFVSFLVLSHNF
jgi:hypothetical protein